MRLFVQTVPFRMQNPGAWRIARIAESLAVDNQPHSTLALVELDRYQIAGCLGSVASPGEEIAAKATCPIAAKRIDRSIETALDFAADIVRTATDTDQTPATDTDPIVATDTDQIVATGTDPIAAMDTDPIVAADTDPIVADTDPIVATDTDHNVVETDTDPIVVSNYRSAATHNHRNLANVVRFVAVFVRLVAVFARFVAVRR